MAACAYVCLSSSGSEPKSNKVVCRKAWIDDSGNKETDDKPPDVFLKMIPSQQSAMIATERAMAAKLMKYPHENVVRFIDTHDDHPMKGYFTLSMEVCDSDLYDVVEGSGAMSEAAARPLFVGIVNGLMHCHSIGIYHLDLKPENILLKDGVAKLADFGNSSFDKNVLRPGNTINYAPPECRCMSQKLCDAAAADVWSLGLILYVVVTGHFPWHEANVKDPRYKFWRDAEKRGDVYGMNAVLFGPSEVDNYSPDLVCLIHSMLRFHPDSRLSLAGVKEHPWFCV